MKIYHNPRCSTSRHVLQFIKDAGIEPEIILYLKNPPQRAEILELAELANLPLHALMRQKGTPYHELGLSEKSSQEALLRAYEAHPILLERPFVVHNQSAMLCRPKERIFEWLKPETSS